MPGRRERRRIRSARENTHMGPERFRVGGLDFGDMGNFNPAPAPLGGGILSQPSAPNVATGDLLGMGNYPSVPQQYAAPFNPYAGVQPSAPNPMDVYGPATFDEMYPGESLQEFQRQGIFRQPDLFDISNMPLPDYLLDQNMPSFEYNNLGNYAPSMGAIGSQGMQAQPLNMNQWMKQIAANTNRNPLEVDYSGIGGPSSFTFPSPQEYRGSRNLPMADLMAAWQ